MKKDKIGAVHLLRKQIYYNYSVLAVSLDILIIYGNPEICMHDDVITI